MEPKIKLKYLYRPTWRWDKTDCMWYDGSPGLNLHCSYDNGKTWEKVPFESFPDLKRQEELRKEFPHP